MNFNPLSKVAETVKFDAVQILSDGKKLVLYIPTEGGLLLAAEIDKIEKGEVNVRRQDVDVSIIRGEIIGAQWATIDLRIRLKHSDNNVVHDIGDVDLASFKFAGDLTVRQLFDAVMKQLERRKEEDG